MAIYLDIVFLENLAINYIILLATGLVQKIIVKKIRVVISALIGASSVVLSFIITRKIFTTIYFKIALSLIMVFIAFNPSSVKKMFKSLVLFYLISFAIGGCALAILFVVSPNNIMIANGIIVGNYSNKITITAVILGFIIVQYSFNSNKRMIKSSELICDITIKICGKLVTTKAFIDSGNKLIDPLNGNAVIIAEESLIRKAGINYVEGGDNDTKIRLIPFKTIGKSNGMLIGIQAEYVKIKYQEEETAVNDVIIGIYNKKLSNNYSALVGINLIDGGN